MDQHLIDPVKISHGIRVSHHVSPHRTNLKSEEKYPVCNKSDGRETPPRNIRELRYRHLQI